MALLHDIGDTLGTLNHPDIAAAILKPFVDEKLHWMCRASRRLPGLLFLPLPRPRPGHARAVSRPSALRGHRPFLRNLRPDRLRRILRHRAARLLRTDGPARFFGTEDGRSTLAVRRIRTLHDVVPYGRCRGRFVACRLPACETNTSAPPGGRTQRAEIAPILTDAGRQGRRQLRAAARSAGPSRRARPQRSTSTRSA